MNKKGKYNNHSKEDNPFSTPNDYFNSFSKKMMFKIELVDEIKEFKLLSSINKQNSFITPENYFESNIQNLQVPTLVSLKDETVFSIPSNYFELCAKSIVNKIECIEELNRYPQLNAITKENNYIVPNPYFESSKAKLITDRTHHMLVENRSVKVLNIVFSKKTVYAIAALLIISLGLYFFNSKTEAADLKCDTLACLEKKEIFNANQLIHYDEDVLLELVNTEDLSRNLNSTLEIQNQNPKTENVESFLMDNIDINDITDEI